MRADFALVRGLLERTAERAAAEPAAAQPAAEQLGLFGS
jgi:hypothetical protein